MFDLDAAVGAWRAGFARDRGFSASDLDELEDHLRAAYEVELHLSPDLAPATAFAQARAVLGTPDDLSGEYAKVGGRAWRRLLTAGRAMFLLAFLLPVHRFGTTVLELDPNDLFFPGLEALWVALTGGGGALGVLSGLTNLAMAAAFWRTPEAGRHRVGAFAGLLLASAALNLCWLGLVDHPTDLLAGYWAWTASFGLAGAGLLLRARDLPAPSGHELLAEP